MDLEEGLRLAEAATPRPWKWSTYAGYFIELSGNDEVVIGAEVRNTDIASVDIDPSEAFYLEWFANNGPALIQMVQELQQENERLRAEIKDAQGCVAGQRLMEALAERDGLREENERLGRYVLEIGHKIADLAEESANFE